MTTGAVGIDLGTTFSAIAHVNQHGVPEILPNLEGDRITPSVILFEDGEPIVGTYAKQAAVVYPEQVVEFVRSRYGDYVLLDPPLKLSTLVLWFGGPAVLVVAGAALWLWLGRRNVAAAAAGPAPLDAAEQRRLDDLLGGEDG